MKKLTDDQWQVLLSLFYTGHSVRLTRIAQQLYPHTRRSSAWASPICLSLVTIDLLDRTKRGWYSITQKGRDFVHETINPGGKV